MRSTESVRLGHCHALSQWASACVSAYSSPVIIARTLTGGRAACRYRFANQNLFRNVPHRAGKASPKSWSSTGTPTRAAMPILRELFRNMALHAISETAAVNADFETAVASLQRHFWPSIWFVSQLPVVFKAVPSRCRS